jgi:hypothetical protein
VPTILPPNILLPLFSSIGRMIHTGNNVKSFKTEQCALIINSCIIFNTPYATGIQMNIPLAFTSATSFRYPQICPEENNVRNIPHSTLKSIEALIVCSQPNSFEINRFIKVMYVTSINRWYYYHTRLTISITLLIRHPQGHLFEHTQQTCWE